MLLLSVVTLLLSLMHDYVLQVPAAVYLPHCTVFQTTSLSDDTGLRWQQTAKQDWLSED